jgi:hypothetical protein
VLAVNPRYAKFLTVCWHSGYKIAKIMELQSSIKELANLSKKDTLEAFAAVLDTHFKYGMNKNGE